MTKVLKYYLVNFTKGNENFRVEGRHRCVVDGRDGVDLGGKGVSRGVGTGTELRWFGKGWGPVDGPGKEEGSFVKNGGREGYR